MYYVDSGIMFAESAVTEVNTSLLVVANENRRVYVFVLVVLNGQDYSQANQIWEQFDQSEGAIGWVDDQSDDLILV